MLDARREVEVRREAEVDDLRDCPRELADRDRDEAVRLLLDRLEAERLEAERLELARAVLDPADAFLPRCDLVSPFSRRILFTVRAATSSARPP